jgi:hypothetical protein
MGNCNPLIFLRQDYHLSGVHSNFDAISNSYTPNIGRENANRSFRPDENVIHFEKDVLQEDLHSERPVCTPVDRKSGRMRWPRAPSGSAKRGSVAFQNWSRSVWSGIETCACGQRARTWSCPSQNPSSISFPEGGSRNLGERLSAPHIDVGPALPAGREGSKTVRLRGKSSQ